MKIHELKIAKPHFSAVVKGEKKAEIRFNDRAFKEGDVLHLRETISKISAINDFQGPRGMSLELCANPSDAAYAYSGRDVLAKITHISDFMQAENFVVLSIEVV